MQSSRRRASVHRSAWCTFGGCLCWSFSERFWEESRWDSRSTIARISDWTRPALTRERLGFEDMSASDAMWSMWQPHRMSDFCDKPNLLVTKRGITCTMFARSGRVFSSASHGIVLFEHFGHFGHFLAGCRFARTARCGLRLPRHLDSRWQALCSMRVRCKPSGPSCGCSLKDSDGSGANPGIWQSGNGMWECGNLGQSKGSEKCKPRRLVISGGPYSWGLCRALRAR